MIRVEIVKMPAFLASALINGDDSGIEESDRHWVDKAIAYCSPGEIVSCEGEAYFSWHCELPGFDLGADMLDYVVHYDERDL